MERSKEFTWVEWVAPINQSDTSETAMWGFPGGKHWHQLKDGTEVDCICLKEAPKKENAN